MSRYDRAMTRIRLLVGGALAVVTMLSGCVNPPKTICPSAAVVREAATITKFTADGSGIAYQAEILDADLDCSYNNDLLDEMEVNMRIPIAAAKGPAAPSEETELQYFVAILDRRGNIITRKVLPLELDFDGDRQIALTEEIWQYYRLKNAGGGGALYEIWVGFQLSDQELEYNRQQGARPMTAAPSG